MENIRIKKIEKENYFLFPNNHCNTIGCFEQRGKVALNLRIKRMKTNRLFFLIRN